MSTISKTLLCIVGGMFLVMASTTSQADTVAGSSELSLYGNATHSSGDTVATAALDYGYYFTDQIRGIFGVSAFGTSAGSDSINIGARAGVVYDFRAQGDTAYIGGQVRAFDVSDARDTSVGYVYVGYRSWIGENSAFFIQGGYARNLRGSGDAAIGEFGLTFFFN